MIFDVDDFELLLSLLAHLYKMVGSFIHYPKYGVDIISYDNHTFLGITYRYHNRVFLISKSTNKKEFVKDIRMMGDLKKKDGLLNSELELTINKFYNNGLIYYLPRASSKKILNAYNINYKGFFVINLKDNRIHYYDLNNNVLINNIMFP